MKSEPVETGGDLRVVHTPDPAPDAPAVARAEVPVPVAAQRRGGKIARLFSELPLVLVIGGVGLGLVVIALHHFRWGSLAISITVLGAALLRLVLPARKAGLLVVRSRFTDVLTLGVTGGALMVLAAVTST